jgi:hypothetical protein
VERESGRCHGEEHRHHLLQKPGGPDSLEIAHPPFAYILSVDQTIPTIYCGNITGFADLRIGQSADLEIDLQVGFGHTPLPADLRSKAALEADRAENRRDAALDHLWVPPNARAETAS